MLLKLSRIFKHHPILRGMVTYSLLMPSSNATQQMLDPKRSKFNPLECVQFGIYGGFILAPTLYGWVKLASVLVKGNSFRSCITKALLEQVTWAPFTYTQFYIGINLLEGKPLSECYEVLKEKFWTTYKAGLCIWPLLQTINFKWVPEKNRVPFVSFFSFLWNVFMSYMHHRSFSKGQTNLVGENSINEM